MSHDFSNRPELTGLSRIVQALARVAAPMRVNFFLMGAGARDLMLEGVSVTVASVPSQTVLKIAAWRDRKIEHPGRDAGDLFLFFKHYLNLGNMDRTARMHADLFDIEPFDSQEAGVRLLARDLGPSLDANALQRVVAILVPEADEKGSLLLASQSGLDLEHARRLLVVFCAELVGLQAARRRSI